MALIDTIRLAFECPMAWDRLVGGDTTRYCHRCDKQVQDLTAMTSDEVEVFLLENEGLPICVRMEVDADRRAVHRPKLPLLVAGGAVALAAAGLSLALEEGPRVLSLEEQIEEVLEQGGTRQPDRGWVRIPAIGAPGGVDWGR